MRGRLGAGRDGRPAVQLRHSDADRDLGNHARPGRSSGDRGAAGHRPWADGWPDGWRIATAASARFNGAILWFAVFTFLSGLAQNFEQLFAARALMGLGFGGEWAAGAVLLGEVIRPEHRGKALGMMQAGWAVGWGAAALLYALFFSVLPPEIAWRALFLVGIAPALLVFFVRRYVEEPAVYLENRAPSSRRAANEPSFFEIFRPPLLRITLLGGLMGTGAQGGYYAVTTWLPTFLRTERKLSVLDSARLSGASRSPAPSAAISRADFWRTASAGA